MGLLTGKRPKLGVQDGRLTPCPQSPNCVCSQCDSADTRHYIPPIEIRGDVQTALSRLAEIAAAYPRTKILSQTNEYLRAECTTLLLRFTDDVEFLLDAAAKVLHVRSASRLGHSDLNANRNRVETIRQQYINAETPHQTAAD